MNPNMKSDALVVKELAWELGVSDHYVYQMRHCGFKMDGDRRCNQTAKLRHARAWIYEHEFRLVDSLGVVGAGQYQFAGLAWA